ncbi:MAG TPA: AlkA N-terminal domain-containing protein [Gammaproteobacteria bacterium]|nr:AlkA N-terminal domain-containing protein [Gammaproteobacteria bacterium]
MAAPDRQLPTRAPFHLEATVRVLQRRPANRVEIFDYGLYRRLFRTAAGLALVQVENHGALDAPDVRYAVLHGEAAPAQLEPTLRNVLGLDIDPLPLQRLTESEAAMRPTALALRGMRPPRFAEWFEAFGNVVPFQQVSLEAGIAIVGRFVERFGEWLDFDGRRYYAFPAPAVVAEAGIDALRGCGLSRTKAATLERIAAAIESDELSEARLAAMPTAEATAALTALPGIGPWSAGLVLLRGLGRLDVFPPGDVGAMRGLNKLLRLDSDGDGLARVAERFGDYRGYLYFHALGRSLLDKGLIRPAPAPT